MARMLKDNTGKKKVIFMSDFSPNENGYAGPQTAYNFIKLFDNADYLMLVDSCNYKEIKPSSEWVLNKDYFLYNYFFSYQTRNRLNHICNFLKYTINPRVYIPGRRLLRKIRVFKPDSVVFITNTAFIYRAATVIKRMFPSVKVFFYIMDDYRHYENSYLQKSIDYIFSRSNGWISISDSMANLFITKYPSLRNKPRLVIQNPVDPKRLVVKHGKINLEKVRLVYAGSVYPNHKDALLKVIEAINTSYANIELAIYTKAEFRSSFQEYESDLVVYKGNLSYKELQADLTSYDYGLVTESFLEQYTNFARSSIQTKVNDYILTGCLPVVIGPVYGACINHISANRLGHIFTNNNPDAIKDWLEQLKEDKEYNSLINSAQSYLSQRVMEIKRSVSTFVE
jgi:glycosyltransferase involved in cell wall biosynthesis